MFKCLVRKLVITYFNITLFLFTKRSTKCTVIWWKAGLLHRSFFSWAEKSYQKTHLLSWCMERRKTIFISVRFFSFLVTNYDFFFLKEAIINFAICLSLKHLCFSDYPFPEDSSEHFWKSTANHLHSILAISVL